MTTHPVAVTDEDALVNLAKSGDPEAFEQLAQRSTNTSIRLAISILRDRQEAEDEVQNAMLKAWQHLGQFEQGSKFSTWFTRIVVNQCLMRLRQVRRVSMAYLDDAPEGEGPSRWELQDHGANAEEQLGQSEVAGVVRKEIRRMPPLLRSVIELRDLEQLPIEEVAGRLEISLAAAKSRLLRARAELRQRLLKHQGRLGPATLMA
jgi:RNA polymerase sigma-70 factor, ECF subfamily